MQSGANIAVKRFYTENTFIPANIDFKYNYLFSINDPLWFPAQPFLGLFKHVKGNQRYIWFIGDFACAFLFYQSLDIFIVPIFALKPVTYYSKRRCTNKRTLSLHTFMLILMITLIIQTARGSQKTADCIYNNNSVYIRSMFHTTWHLEWQPVNKCLPYDFWHVAYYVRDPVKNLLAQVFNVSQS